jgi:uracil-DNA glycosylase family 4
VGLTLNVIREPDEFCKPCGAYKTCDSPIMNGSGSEHPIWFFVGESPGATEDELNKPFQGQAGRLLKKMIKAVGIPLKYCRFSNVVKCRPPDNNIKFYPNIIDHCRPHILREIHAVRPKVVVLLGNSAIKSILNRTGITKLHGEVFDAGPWKYVCSLHPSYFLHNDTPAALRKFREALKIAKNTGDKKASLQKKRNHIMVTDHKTLQEMRDLLMAQKYLAHDIEGSTLNAFSKVRTPRIGCAGYAWSDNDACCFPLASRRGINVKVRPEEFLEVMKEVNENEDIRHILQFGNYDYVYQAVLHDIWIGGKKRCGYYADTGQMMYVLDESKGAPRGLKDWAYRLGMGGYELKKREYERSHKECNSAEGGNANKIPMPILGPYNMDDNIATWRLFWKLKKRLVAQRLWERPFLFPQMWHVWTASILEINGLKIDADRNKELDQIFTEKIEKADEELHDYPQVKKLQSLKDRDIMLKIYERVKNYKRPPESVKDKVIELFENVPKEKKIVNLNSPESRRTLVFDILKYKPLWRTKKGKNWSVEKEVLEKLLQQRQSVVLKRMVERNSLVSAKDKYIDPVVAEWMGTDGGTHTDYSPHGQLTGRVSSKEPNHENLPKHGDLAKDLRSQFVSSGPEYYILEQDSKQIEMRLFCDRAQDDIMMEEFNQGKDPHAMGAMAGFEISEKDWLKLPDEERKHLRFLAKSAISFGLLYGRGPEALAEEFQKSIGWARRFIRRYFAKYDDCLIYRQEREDYIIDHKIVYSHFFRPRRLPEVDADSEAVVAEAIRQGINSPIQGDASDITWVALHRLNSWLRKYHMKSKGIIAVHDAAYVDTHYKEMEDVVERLYMYMTDRKFIEKMTGWYCTVPWNTDCFIGPHLGKSTELAVKGPGEFIVPKEFKVAA